MEKLILENASTRGVIYKVACQFLMNTGMELNMCINTAIEMYRYLESRTEIIIKDSKNEEIDVFNDKDEFDEILMIFSEIEFSADGLCMYNFMTNPFIKSYWRRKDTICKKVKRACELGLLSQFYDVKGIRRYKFNNPYSVLTD